MGKGSRMAARNDVIVTTADTVAGRETVEEIDIVAAECVFGMNKFRDLFASIRDVFGGRSQSYQRVFRDARDTVKSELKEQAAALGAHAVVATRFTYNQLDGTSGGMVMVSIALMKLSVVRLLPALVAARMKESIAL